MIMKKIPFRPWESILLSWRGGLSIKLIIGSCSLNTSVLTSKWAVCRHILAELNEVVEEDFDNEENKNKGGELFTKPGIKEVIKTVQILENISYFWQYGKAMLKALEDINCSIGKYEFYN